MMQKRHTHARGRARREILLDAAKTLLQERDIDLITLPVIAERAGIPPSSVYHFYAEIGDLHIELVKLIADEMTGIGLTVSDPADWRALVSAFLSASRHYFNGNRAALQLMLGAKTPPQIKHAACYDGYRFGIDLRDHVARHFLLPPMADQISVFFRAVQIADALFSLSVHESGRVTDKMLAEAEIAAIGYLGHYLPPFLLPRETGEPACASLAESSVAG